MVVALLSLAGVVTPVSPASAAPSTTCNIVTGADVPSQQVARLYKAVFHRPPEPQGWNYWKGVVATRSLFDIASFFVEAPEFVNLYGSASNDEFVRLVYQNVMGREPEPSGYEYWLGVLNRGELTRGDMVVYFSESSEFKRREENIYFERCAVALKGSPSALWSTGFKVVHETTREVLTEVEYLSTLDRTTNSSSYVKEQIVGSGDNWLGHRSGDQTCVSWRSTEALTVRNVLMGAHLEHASLLINARAGVDFYDDPGPHRQRIANFQTAVRDAYGFGVDGCDPDEPALIRTSYPNYQLLFEQQAGFVDIQDGFVRRVFDLKIDDIRAIINSGDTSIFDLVPTIAGDLEAVDQSRASDDGLWLTVRLWEDPTGNVVMTQSAYHGRLTIDGVPWMWDETTVLHRVPGDW